MASENRHLTSSQQTAVTARGNVLVMAGAGTGKTHTLVERCLDLIRKDHASLDEILVVTFTEAAAAEMRHRLRMALERAAGETADPFLIEQIALFDAAHIGTLHGFCLKLVREHFHELGLDPQLSILAEGEARLLAADILEEQFNAHYEADDEFSRAVQDLIAVYGHGRDEKIRTWVLRLHRYLQTQAAPEIWSAKQLAAFSSQKPADWNTWLSDEITIWCREWTDFIKSIASNNVKALECSGLLTKFKGPEVLGRILATDGKENFPKGQFGRLREPLKLFFDEARFLQSLTGGDGRDPLAEDWGWVRSHMLTLLRLAGEFSGLFAARKNSDGVLDFQDLEQFALKLLWDTAANKPTPIALRWREQLRFVLVDEYQDINGAQDRIILALSREGNDANRFLVGDVKQSIYRFRLADPAIFRGYLRAWAGKKDATVALTENFRSRKGVLDFVNSLFGSLMREEIGGVPYDESARLRFAGGEEPGDIDVELRLRFKAGGRAEPDVVDTELADLEESEKEARMLALRLVELKDSKYGIRDPDGTIRPVDWRDMAILLRAPSGKAEVFAKQFEKIGVPLVVERGGFYDSAEIADILCLLQLLDNPLQDVPLIAVLRSPLVGLSLDQLAEIRLLARGRFWFALTQSAAAKSPGSDATRVMTDRFLQRFGRWRKTAKQVSLSQCLEQILDETHYAGWLAGQPRGPQRVANVERLMHLAQKFDQFQRQGLFRFLKFIEAQREADAEPEVAAAAAENAVRLLSIHQSKGLEFPVVAVADLGKNFNLRDLREEIIFDETYGLCPRVKPPGTGGRYPSLPYWLAQKNQRRELAGEELRLLYVACTRAKDLLILTGGLPTGKWETWTTPAPITVRDIVSAKSHLDWIGLWFRNQPPLSPKARQGEVAHLRWRIAGDDELVQVSADDPRGRVAEIQPFDPATIKQLRETLSWGNPHATAAQRPAKSSVTALRREANDDLAAEAEEIFPAKSISRTSLSAADTGLAHHKFLQHMSLDTAAQADAFATEADRLFREKILSEPERAALNLKNLAAFWSSDVGKEIVAHANDIRRELPFTARFSPDELDRLLKPLQKPASVAAADEFVVVQGVADLVVLRPDEIWLVDFKTDAVRPADLPAKVEAYKPQLKLYAAALEKIYLRPVKNSWLHFLEPQRTEKIGP